MDIDEKQDLKGMVFRVAGSVNVSHKHDDYQVIDNFNIMSVSMIDKAIDVY